MVLFQDSDNCVELVREMVRGKQTIVLARGIDGSPEAVLIEEYPPPKVDLNISVGPEGLQIAWAAPGSSETRIEQSENCLGHGTEIWVGPLVRGRNGNIRAIFSSLKLYGMTPTLV
jgi:hypothetical protein